MSRFFFIYFTIIGVNKIVRYIESATTSVEAGSWRLRTGKQTQQTGQFTSCLK